MSSSRRCFRSSSVGDQFGMLSRPFFDEKPISLQTVNSSTVTLHSSKLKYTAKKEKENSPSGRGKVVFMIEPLTCDGREFKAWYRKDVDEGYEVFVKECYKCKKELLAKKEIYLYGYLGAFCCEECRDKQMDLDGFHKNFKIWWDSFENEVFKEK